MARRKWRVTERTTHEMLLRKDAEFLALLKSGDVCDRVEEQLRGLRRRIKRELEKRAKRAKRDIASAALTVKPEGGT